MLCLGQASRTCNLQQSCGMIIKSTTEQAVLCMHVELFLAVTHFMIANLSWLHITFCTDRDKIVQLSTA